MNAEREWVILVSFSVILCTLVFFIGAPTFLGFPLEFDQVIRILQIIIPVFVAYLGLAVAFVLEPIKYKARNLRLLKILLRGSVYVCIVALILAVAVFWYSNRASGPPGTGMSVDQLCWFLTFILGFLPATAGLIVAKIFPAR